MPRKKRPDGEIIVSLEEMKQEINLENYLGRKPTPREKQTFADLAVDVITNRTLDGKTINGGKFARYSKKYADLKGVTQDSVDLFLNGDMLDNLGRVENDESDSSVVIALDESQTAKGYNHNVGDTLKKREWFGLTDDEVKSITRRMGTNTGRGRRVTLSELRSALDVLGIQQTD